ncbi:MAG: methyltransferase [Cyclobacteriaceae bacterium]
MKVTTEACIMGAWTSVDQAKHILDIGAGTGLLSLMLAQRTQASIIGLEIDREAAREAQSNFEHSPWKERLSCLNTSLQAFKTQAKFDQIICNPPFFKNHALSDNSRRNHAIHTVSLTSEDLARRIKTLLNPLGKATVLYPKYEQSQMKDIMRRFDFYPDKELSIFNRPQDIEPLRQIVTYSSTQQSLETENLLIRDQSNDYSHEFIKLLKPYYLNL